MISLNQNQALVDLKSSLRNISACLNDVSCLNQTLLDRYYYIFAILRTSCILQKVWGEALIMSGKECELKTVNVNVLSKLMLNMYE